MVAERILASLTSEALAALALGGYDRINASRAVGEAETEYSVERYPMPHAINPHDLGDGQ